MHACVCDCVNVCVHRSHFFSFGPSLYTLYSHVYLFFISLYLDQRSPDFLLMLSKVSYNLHSLSLKGFYIVNGYISTFVTSLVLFLHLEKSKILFLYFSLKMRLASPTPDRQLPGSRECVSFPAPQTWDPPQPLARMRLQQASVCCRHQPTLPLFQPCQGKAASSLGRIQVASRNLVWAPTLLFTTCETLD